MIQTAKDLDRAALAAYARGDTWAAFWAHHAADVAKAEPYDRAAYGRLVRRLLALVASGDLDGQHPAGDPEPWLGDDEAGKPSDTGTAARLDWERVNLDKQVSTP